MALSDDDLSSLSASQREAYAEARRRCEGEGNWLQGMSSGKPLSRTYAEAWKSEFGEAFGFLFFLGSVVLFPMALVIAGALEFGTDNELGPALGIYVGLIVGLSLLKATLRADHPPGRPPIEDLRVEYPANVDLHWRAVAASQGPSGPGNTNPGHAHRQLTPPPTKMVQIFPSPAPPQRSGRARSTRSSDSSRGEGAHLRKASPGGNISSGNRSIPGSEFTPWIGADDKLALAEKFNWTCQLCLKSIDPTISHDYESPDSERLVIDHIKPRKHGGTDHPGNLQPAHHLCNLRKGDRLITNEEFRRWEANRAQEPESQLRPQRHSNELGSASSWPTTQQVNQSPSNTPGGSRKPRPSGPRAQHAPIGPRPKQTAAQQARSELFWSKRHEGLLTHCEQGHEFTEANTYYRLRPDRTWGIERECRACRRESQW